MNHQFEDIVITGYSAITPAGIGICPITELIRSGGDALSCVPDGVESPAGFRWGKADNFKVSEYIPPLKARKMDRCSQFAVVASGLALRDAAIDLTKIAPERVGIAMGSGFCGVANSAEFLTGYFTNGVDGMVPMIFPNTVPNAPASNASIEHGFKGPNVTLVQRFCSAESALLAASRFLQEGRADVMLVGGTDELTPLMMSGFSALKQLRPGGIPCGEGCGMLVLERLSHARQRSAGIKGQLLAIRSIGALIPGFEQQGLELLASSGSVRSLISLSGCASDREEFCGMAAGTGQLDLGRVIGRSLSMGATAVATLIASLDEGALGLHLAASPHGPYYAIDVRGGFPV